jgi:tetratricopeptide (TPR) repeat protein
VNPLLVQALGYRQAGDFRSADALCAQVLAQEPGNAGAWHLRGVLAYQTGDIGTAVAMLERAVTIEPHEAMYWSNLGLFRQAAGRVDDAIAAFRHAIALQPDFEQARTNLASALNAKGDFAAAEAECRAALRLRPNLAAAENNLGVALAAQERTEEALACFHRAVTLNPNSTDAHRNLGHALREQGAFDEARREYQAVIALNPWECRAYYSMALTRRHGMADRPDMERLEARLAGPDLAPADRAELHFALGKMYDDCGLYDQAFAHFQRGNEMVRPAWDRLAFARSVDAMIDAFRPERIAGTPASGHASEQPVFIVGMPRSGTTLVEQILATNSQVAACGEVMDVSQIATELQTHSAPDAPWPGCLLTIDPVRLLSLAEWYLGRRLTHHPDALRTTDKMPRNSFHLGLIWRLFPNARIIHCRRDPRDVCLSCYFINFSMRLEFACDLEDLAFFHGLHDRVMAHWQAVLPLRILSVDYEQLVADPGLHTRRIVEFCGLEWEDRYLRFHENRNTVRTSSGWQVRQPMYSTAVGRWRNYEQHLAPLLKALAAYGK